VALREFSPSNSNPPLYSQTYTLATTSQQSTKQSPLVKCVSGGIAAYGLSCLLYGRVFVAANSSALLRSRQLRVNSLSASNEDEG